MTADRSYCHRKLDFQENDGRGCVGRRIQEPMMRRATAHRNDRPAGPDRAIVRRSVKPYGASCHCRRRYPDWFAGLAAPGGRRCEQASRGVLEVRASSVFSAIGRVPLQQAGRAEADAVSKASGGLGVRAQARGLASKLR